MRRLAHLGALAGLVAHHGIEFGHGVGLPGEPLLGQRRALAAWSAVFLGDAWLATRSDSAPVLALADGAYQALALQHYVDWDWQWRADLPLITEAEGLPAGALGAYNAALLAVVVLAAADSCPQGRTGRLLHLAGLATLPLQLASARHHQRWLRDRDR